MHRVAVIGQGYVGLPLALSAAKSGFQVIGYDINSDLVRELNLGHSKIEDIPDSELTLALESGNYLASNNADDIAEVDVAIIAVPTPLDEHRIPDLDFLRSASQILGRHLKQETLIINESTSFPGTLRNLVAKEVLNASPIQKNHWFAVSPERVDPGNKNWKIKNTARLFSGLDQEATKKTRDFYSKFCENLVEVDSPEVAEAAKLFENTFRQVNIALVNEFAKIMYKLNIPVHKVLDAAATKPHGFMKFTPGIGVGGHCIPVDPIYLAMSAKNAGITPEFINLSNAVNLSMPIEIVERIQVDNGGDLKGKNILVCGIAYKANVSDTRETPSKILIENLISKGAKVTWYDPLVSLWEESVGLENLPGNEFDITVVATLHDVMDQDAIMKSAKYVFDCTGILDKAVTL